MVFDKNIALDDTKKLFQSQQSTIDQLPFEFLERKRRKMLFWELIKMEKIDHIYEHYVIIKKGTIRATNTTICLHNNGKDFS